MRPTALAELSQSMQQLSERVSPSVVEILASGVTPVEGAESSEGLLSRRESSASGVILAPDGYILTNAHAVVGAEQVRVRFAVPFAPGAPGKSIVRPRGKLVDAEIVGMDRETDLAVLKVPETGLTPLALGDSDRLQPGELVLAFGGPLGLQNSVTMGIVSAVGRQLRLEDPMVYIQTDTPINPGNSGGPLVRGDGQVVGINTLIYSQSGGSEGVGFAVPSNIALTVYEQIRKSGHVRRGIIGVNAQTVTPALAAALGLSQNWGVVLADVNPEGPAGRSGLEIGDLVLRLDGKSMENGRQFDVNLYRRVIGDVVTLDVLRGSKQMTVKVPVIERHDDPDRFARLVSAENNLVPKLGILGIALTSELSELLPPLRSSSGVLVAAAASPGLRFANGGLRAGDVIHTVNGAEVSDLPGLRQALDAASKDKPAVLQVERSGVLWYVTVEGT
jgi:serine protease Do